MACLIYERRRWRLRRAVTPGHGVNEQLKRVPCVDEGNNWCKCYLKDALLVITVPDTDDAPLLSQRAKLANLLASGEDFRDGWSANNPVRFRDPSLSFVPMGLDPNPAATPC